MNSQIKRPTNKRITKVSMMNLAALSEGDLVYAMPSVLPAPRSQSLKRGTQKPVLVKDELDFVWEEDEEMQTGIMKRMDTNPEKDVYYAPLRNKMQEYYSEHPLPFSIDARIQFPVSPLVAASDDPSCPTPVSSTGHEMGELVVELIPRTDLPPAPEMARVLVIAVDLSSRSLAMTYGMQNLKTFLVALIQHRKTYPNQRFFINLAAVHEGKVTEIFGGITESNVEPPATALSAALEEAADSTTASVSTEPPPVDSFQEWCPRKWTRATITSVNSSLRTCSIQLWDSQNTFIEDLAISLLRTSPPIVEPIPTTSKKTKITPILIPRVGDVLYYSHIDIFDQQLKMGTIMQTLNNILERVARAQDAHIYSDRHKRPRHNSSTRTTRFAEEEDEQDEALLNFHNAVIHVDKLTQIAQNIFPADVDRSVIMISNGAAYDDYRVDSLYPSKMPSSAPSSAPSLPRPFDAVRACTRSTIKFEITETILSNIKRPMNRPNCHVYWLCASACFDIDMLSEVAFLMGFGRTTILAADNLNNLYVNFAKVMLEITTTVAWNVVIVVETFKGGSEQQVEPPKVNLKDLPAVHRYHLDEVVRKYGVNTSCLGHGGAQFSKKIAVNPFEPPDNLLVAPHGEKKEVHNFTQRMTANMRYTFPVYSTDPDSMVVRIYLEHEGPVTTGVSTMRNRPPAALLTEVDYCLLPSFGWKMEVLELVNCAAKSVLAWKYVVEMFPEMTAGSTNISFLRAECKRLFDRILASARHLIGDYRHDTIKPTVPLAAPLALGLFYRSLLDDVALVYLSLDKRGVDKSVTYMRLMQLTNPKGCVGNFGAAIPLWKGNLASKDEVAVSGDDSAHPIELHQIKTTRFYFAAHGVATAPSELLGGICRSKWEAFVGLHKLFPSMKKINTSDA